MSRRLTRGALAAALLLASLARATPGAASRLAARQDTTAGDVAWTAERAARDDATLGEVDRSAQWPSRDDASAVEVDRTAALVARDDATLGEVDRSAERTARDDESAVEVARTATRAAPDDATHGEFDRSAERTARPGATSDAAEHDAARAAEASAPFGDAPARDEPPARELPPSGSTSSDGVPEPPESSGALRDACDAACVEAKRQALAARGLVLVPSSGWTEDVLDDLAAGLEAFPPGARAFPGGPLEVALHAEATPLGLGDAAHPLFTDGLRRLNLYAYAEDDDARAAMRLARLDASERERLWRRRAVVHAVLRRWDERLRWSHRAGWRGLSGWRGDDALLVYAWAFSRRAGMASPALDLATFAEELLVPAESLVPDAVRADQRVRCLEPSKARFLDERLAALDAAWAPARDCPAFDAWADLAHVRGAEVIFAAPSTVSSQAIFGHVLLRVVREGDDEAAGGGRVMQLAALVSPFEARTSYVWRGLTGGFRGVFSLSTVADVQHEALGLEQRSLRRFALELTEAQRTRLVERLWEFERVGYLDYRFFTANCAAMLRFLLEPVLGDDAPGAPATPWEAPTQVLDALAPWLKPVGVDEASGEVALRAEGVLHGLLRVVPVDVREGLGAAWAEVERLEAGPPAARVGAYRALLRVTAPREEPGRAPAGVAPPAGASRDDDRTPLRPRATAADPAAGVGSPARVARGDDRAVESQPADSTRDDASTPEDDGPGVEPRSTDAEGADRATPRGEAASSPGPGRDAASQDWLARVALAALRRERFALDEATVDRIRMERGTVLPGWRGPSTDELVASRQRRFESGTTRRVRTYDELTELLALDALLRASPRRALTASEQRLLEAEAEARATFQAAADLVAAVPEEALTRALDAERSERARRDAELVERGVPEGGHGHAFVGVGVASTGAALARLRLAALFEQLGDQRWGGFGPRVGARLLDAHVEVALSATPTVHRAGFTPLEVRAVTARGWGWGAGGAWTYADGAHEVTALGEGLFVLASDARLTNFLLAAAGVRAGLRADAFARGLVEPRAGLEARLQLPGSFANALRAEVTYAPRWLGGAGFQHGVTARLGVVVRLGRLRGVAFSVRADGEATWRAGEAVSGQGTLGLTLD